MAADLTALGNLLERVRDAAIKEPEVGAEESVAELHPEGEALIEFVLRFSVLTILSSSIAAVGSRWCRRSR